MMLIQILIHFCFCFYARSEARDEARRNSCAAKKKSKKQEAK